MRRGAPFVVGLTLLGLAACFAVMLTQESCITAYEHHARAVAVQAEVTSIRTATVHARENKRDVTYDVATLHLRAPWNGDHVSRTRSERLGPSFPAPKIGDTRRIYVDPQSPHTDVPGVWPAWVFLWPGVAALGCLLAGLFMIISSALRKGDP